MSATAKPHSSNSGETLNLTLLPWSKLYWSHQPCCFAWLYLWFRQRFPPKKKKKKKKRNPETEQKPWSQGHCDLPKEAKHLGCAPHLHSHPSPPVPTGLRVTGCSPSSKTDWLDGSFHPSPPVPTGLRVTGCSPSSKTDWLDGNVHAFTSGSHNSNRVLAPWIVSVQTSTWLSNVGANP